MSDATEQMLNVFILVIILGMGITAFVNVQGNQIAQLMVGVIIAVAYALWGLVHHWTQESLHKKIVIEYVLIGAIAVSVLITLSGI